MSAAQTEPMQVVVRVTLMRIQENRLKELGFDWLLSPFDFGNIFASGGTVGNGVAIDDIPGVPGINPSTDGPDDLGPAQRRPGDSAGLDRCADRQHQPRVLDLAAAGARRAHLQRACSARASCR